MNKQQQELIDNLTDSFAKMDKAAPRTHGLINVDAIKESVENAIAMKKEISAHNITMDAMLKEQVKVDFEKISDNLRQLGLMSNIEMDGARIIIKKKSTERVVGDKPLILDYGLASERVWDGVSRHIQKTKSPYIGTYSLQEGERLKFDTIEDVTTNNKFAEKLATMINNPKN